MDLAVSLREGVGVLPRGADESGRQVHVVHQPVVVGALSARLRHTSSQRCCEERGRGRSSATHRDNLRSVDEGRHADAALEVEELLRPQGVVVARVALGVVHVAAVVRVHEHDRVGQHAVLEQCLFAAATKTKIQSWDGRILWS